MPYITVVRISQDFPELLQLMEVFSIEDRLLPCKLISTEGYYLHVEVAVKDSPGNFGELLIPHHCVELVLTGMQDKTLGFLRAAK